jgi:hypothetical protein
MSLAISESGRSESTGAAAAAGRTDPFDDPERGHPEVLILYMLASCAGFAAGIVLGAFYWL